MRQYLWQLPHIYILIGYSVVVLVGLVLTSAPRRVRTSRVTTTILQPALMLLSLPGPVIMGSFLKAHAYIGFLSWSFSGTPEARCLALEDMIWVSDQIMLVAIVCAAALTLAAVFTLLLQRALTGKRGQPTDGRKWPLAVLLLALLGTAFVVRGPSLRDLLAPSLLGDCLYASQDLPVSSVVGEPAGRIPRRATMVEVREDAILVNDLKVASLEGWTAQYDITGPLVTEVEHHLEMRNALCERGYKDDCAFPSLLIGASREAPTSLVVEVARIAWDAWKGPCSLVIRTEPAPDPPRGLDETIEAISRDGRIRCTTECPYALIGIDAPAKVAPEAGKAVLPDDPDLKFGDFIAGVEEETTGVILPAPADTVEEPPAGWYRANLQRTGEYDARGVPELGGLRWKFKTGADVRVTPVLDSGVVYFSSDDHHIYAVDAETGDGIWKTDIKGSVDSPALYGGKLYFPGGSLHVVNPGTGKVEDLLYGSSSPVIVGGLVFSADEAEGSIVALNLNDQSKAWDFGTGSKVHSSPALEGNVVLGGSVDHFLYALDTSSGKMLWRYDTGIGSSCTPAVIDGVVLYVARDLHAVDVKTGKHKWTFSYNGRFEESPAVADGKVVVSGFNAVYAVDVETGRQAWKFETGNAHQSAPAIARGIVYVGSDDHHLYAVNLDDGTLRWKYETGGRVEGSPLVADGAVFFGSSDGYLYALEGRELASAAGPEIDKRNVSPEELEAQQVDFCDTMSIEFVGLYPVLTELPRADQEGKRYVEALLEKAGFEKTDSGWGNWFDGPRIVHLEYSKGDCTCTLSKEYHFNRKMESGHYNLRVAEQIDCNLERVTDRIKKDLESVSYPVTEEALRKKLGIVNTEPLSAVDIMDGSVNTLSYSHVLPEHCWLHLDVFKDHPAGDWMVSGAEVVCNGDAEKK